MPVEERLCKSAVSNKLDSATVEQWGGIEAVNCYAYAANCKNPGSGKPDPGKRSGVAVKIGDKYDPNLLKNGATQDGMMLMGGSQVDPPSPPNGYYLVALYISEDLGDYHWYRKDEKYGRWTHKPGPQDICNWDGSMQVMPTELILGSHKYSKTPRTNYQFVAFLAVPQAGIAVG